LRNLHNICCDPSPPSFWKKPHRQGALLPEFSFHDSCLAVLFRTRPNVSQGVR
jgi:hypothetical protein